MMILATSCSSNALVINDAPSQELKFPDLEYSALVNVKETIVAITRHRDYSLYAYVLENNQEVVRFNLPSSPDCFQTKYYAYETLPDGRLQIWKDCGSGGNGTNIRLMAYDWVSLEVEELISTLPLGASGASWNPDQTKAIAYLRSGFADNTLFWAWQDGYAVLDLVISDGEKSWNLKDDFPSFAAAEIGKSGSTGRAAWSPDGSNIAFFASPDAIGKLSFDRFNVEYNLYLMNPETLQLEMIADGIYAPFLIVWSPDSSSIAFIGKRGLWKENGLWVYSLQQRMVLKVSSGIFQGIVWRSDTNNLVAIKCEDLESCKQIVEYDLSDILAK